MEIQQNSPKNNFVQILDLSILGVLLLLYAPILLHWVDGWLHKNISTEHEYFSHGIIGLPFAGYVAWLNRKKWHRLPNRFHPLGGLLLFLGGIFYLSGVAGWVNISLPTILTGLCLWFKGTAGFKLQGFALLLVLLATPTEAPYIVAPYTFPLQSFIAHTVGFTLDQLGMNVTVYGINIYINGRIVEVAPYCAGLKMLFTSIYISLILLYWTDTLSSRQIKIYFLSATILLSIISNVIRNTLLSYFHGTGQEQAFAWLHAGWGGDLYSASVLLLLVPLLNWMSDYFLEEPKNNQEF